MILCFFHYLLCRLGPLKWHWGMSLCPWRRTQFESPKFSGWLLGVGGDEKGLGQKIWEMIETQKCRDLFSGLAMSSQNWTDECMYVGTRRCPKGGKLNQKYVGWAKPRLDNRKSKLSVKMEDVALWIIWKDAHQLRWGSGHWRPKRGLLVWFVLNSLCDHHSVQSSDKAQQPDPSSVPRFRSWFHHLLAPWPWPNHLTLLSLSFPLC